MGAGTRRGGSGRRGGRGRLGALVIPLAVAASLLAPSVAVAQSTSKAAAEAAFDEGRRLVAAGHYDEACAKFARSQALEPAAGTLLNLADCYEQAGRTASAWLTYSEAVTRADKSGRAEWAKLAREKVASLRPGLATLRIVFPEVAPEALGVMRDGEPVPVAEAGLKVPVDPGKHTIEARAPGRLPFSTTIDVAARQALEIRVPDLRAQPGAHAPASNRTVATAPGDGASGNAARTWGLALGGVGLGAVVAGGIAGVLALGSRSDAETRCSADLLTCDAAGAAAMERARDQALVSTIGFAAGGALVAVGAVLVLTSPRAAPGTARSTDHVRVELVGSAASARLVARW